MHPICRTLAEDRGRGSGMIRRGSPLPRAKPFAIMNVIKKSPYRWRSRWSTPSSP